MSFREDGHIVFKGNVCPNCNRKDTLIFQKKTGTQTNLDDSKSEVWSKIIPTCTKCGKSFPKGKFDKMR